MARKSNKVEKTPTTEERLADSPVWTLFIRNNSSTSSCEAMVPGDPNCWMFFPHIAEIMKVDLTALSQIFVKKPEWVYNRKPKKQPRQPTAPNYGMPECYLWHSPLTMRGWGALAKLVNKTLGLCNKHGGDEGYITQVAFPDGHVEEYDGDKHGDLFFPSLKAA